MPHSEPHPHPHPGPHAERHPGPHAERHPGPHAERHPGPHAERHPGPHAKPDSAVEYILSTYLTPPGERAVISPRHDHNVSLWRRGPDSVELVRHWELERISGQKHHSWPLYTPERAEAFLSHLLAGEGLTLADVSVSWGTPGLPGYAPLPVPQGAKALPVHSLAHLFSGLLLDTRLFKEANIIAMAVDAAPDLVLERELPSAYYAGCVSVRGALQFTSVESPAPLYHAADRLLGKEPGTLMALASACDTAIVFDAAAEVAQVSLPGGHVQPWAAAFGLVKRVLAEAGRQLAGSAPDARFTAEENLHSAVMKVVQQACELITVRTIDKLCALGGVRPEDCYLSISGGFALNVQTNTQVLDRFGFRGLLTPPCANDSGVALGLGLLGLYGTGAFNEADLRIPTAYQGNELRAAEVDAALAAFAPYIEEVSAFTPEQFAEDLADDVLVWADGAAEMGPRALGHRSLLGDPRSEKTKDRLNEYKQRQWWRPVAPIVLAEYAHEWFEQDRPSPYMLEAARVRTEVKEQVPAVLHLDGTARHQTLTAEDNPLLHRAIEAFRAATGVPIVCNTSLNDKGEPIVDTAAEALNFAVRKGIRIAYLTGRRVVLRTADRPGTVRPAGPHPRATAFFAGQEADRDAIWDSWLERGHTEAGLLLLTGTPQLLADPQTWTPNRVRLLAERLAAKDPAFEQNLDQFRRDHGPGTTFGDAPALRH
ncbi:carbamoyltransferase C-terminal domain-containing protein [Streptomyces sp. NPDC059861]|uniref:carbamoyltransferase C-terminal domain-containing protein n=1 Tax=Streptomyces sp. NPDC059861 TaxID=3346974 RepID=UPI003649152D